MNKLTSILGYILAALIIVIVFLGLIWLVKWLWLALV